MTASEILVTQKEKSKGDDTKPSSYVEQELIFTNFLFENAKLNNQASICYLTKRNIVLMQFCLQGEFNLKNKSGKKAISLKNAEYNIIYIPKGNMILTSTSDELNLVSIFIEEEFFLRQMPKGHISFNYQNSSAFSSIFPKNFYLNPKLKNVLNDMMTCEFDGHLKLLYLKAKVLELLILQLSQHEEESIGLKDSEIEKMMMVKELIENNIDESYSLSYLAKVAGTNEQYLKKHFKLLHGHTVFGYILACKMQKAKEMLLTGKYRITEIAEIVGYRHATHFTSAFKKFFGYLPKVLKTKMLMGGYLSLNMELEIMELFIAI